MFPGRQKILLLDVDGVILTAPKAFSRVSQRATQFVQESLGLAEYAEARDVNRALYTQFGHTLTGLRAVAGSRYTVADFNRAVYDAETYRVLKLDVETPEFQARRRAVEFVLGFARACAVPVYLFSNAPEAWCMLALKYLGVRANIEPEAVFHSEHPLFQNSLKPDPILYQRIEVFLNHTRRSDGAQEYIFADDSFTNLIPILRLPHWRPVYVSAAPVAGGLGGVGCLGGVSSFRSIREIERLTEFLYPPGTIDTAEPLLLPPPHIPLAPPPALQGYDEGETNA